MNKTLLDVSSAPDDPIERLVWLGGVAEQVEREMDKHWQEAYFWARMTGRIDAALALGLHGRKRVMAWTRAGNQAIGRPIRWGNT